MTDPPDRYAAAASRRPATTRPAWSVDGLANYTAFHELRRLLRAPSPQWLSRCTTRRCSATYGDGGNARMLALRLRWRGFPAHLLEVAVPDTLPARVDLYVLGGGKDTAQVLAAERLRADGTLASAAAAARPIFAVYAGTEGAAQGSILATYAHGPALARNPALDDHLLQMRSLPASPTSSAG